MSRAPISRWSPWPLLGALAALALGCGEPLTPAGYRGAPALVVRGEVHSLQPSRWSGDFELGLVWVRAEARGAPTLETTLLPEGTLAPEFELSLYAFDPPPLTNPLSAPPTGWVTSWSCAYEPPPGEPSGATDIRCGFDAGLWRCRVVSGEERCALVIDEAGAVTGSGCAAPLGALSPWEPLGGPREWRRAFDERDPHCAASSHRCSFARDGYRCEAMMSAGAAEGALALGIIAVLERRGDVGEAEGPIDRTRGRASDHVILYAEHPRALRDQLGEVVINPDALGAGYNLAVARCDTEGRLELLVVAPEQIAIVALDLLDDRCAYTLSGL